MNQGPSRPATPVRRALSGNGGEFSRFVLMRVAGTLFSYLIYLALLGLLGYQWSYLVSYIAGIAFAYVTNALLVFRTPMRTASLLRFPLVYVVQLVLTWLVLRLCVEVLGISEVWAFLFASAVALPVTYVMSRSVLRPR